MTRIILNEFNKTMKEIPAKLLLIINAIDKVSAERNGLLRNYLKLI